MAKELCKETDGETVFPGLWQASSASFDIETCPYAVYVWWCLKLGSINLHNVSRPGPTATTKTEGAVHHCRSRRKPAPWTFIDGLTIATMKWCYDVVVSVSKYLFLPGVMHDNHSCIYLKMSLSVFVFLWTFSCDRPFELNIQLQWMTS